MKYVKKQVVSVDLASVILCGKPVVVTVPEYSMKYVRMADEGLYESENGTDWYLIKELPEPSEN